MNSTADPVEPRGAVERQHRYWRIRNARTRALQALLPAGRAWHIAPGHPGGAYSDLGTGPGVRDRHLPTLLTRDVDDRRQEIYRGGCLGCAWEGSEHGGRGWREGANQAVEDAHDHAFPSWRSLPVLDLRTAASPHRAERLWRGITTRYPSGWVDAGAPALCTRPGADALHLPPSGRYPRYRLFVKKPPHRGTTTTTRGEPDLLF
ncbi:hypothetical protein E1265_28930 [Streptomyces sp. 8K308]|uniref:DUF6349 family protein n=1 Tax=Streptomyces sp. 8K308 TaxID=2530388 RepID=UPI0010439F29|nr:DUF6349 family protein [Streptomyces sp. 8K308]TDC12943.1 hypothetical protein E1265_28930 [Streptomyces sp. 8K308]